MAHEWWRPLRDLNDRYFTGPADGVGWADHVAGLNERLGLAGDHVLSTFPGADLPPAWFIGDVTSVVPEDWVLVFSLNPAEDSDAQFYAEREWDAERFWEYQAGWLRSWWNPRFHGPLARLAARCIGPREGESEDAIRRFAATHIVFAELCPYASKRFALSPEALKTLRERDPGCRMEAEITDRMLREGRPCFVLVNGNGAVAHFEMTYGDRLTWALEQYASEARPGKRLWHMRGSLRVKDWSIPVLGFPFLRKPATHNFGVEIEQLGQAGAALLGEFPRETSRAG